MRRPCLFSNAPPLWQLWTIPSQPYVFGLLLLRVFSRFYTIPFLHPLASPGNSREKEARRHLERAAYLNFASAQYKLGNAYEFTEPPSPFGALLSVQHYSLASQQGEIQADMALSKWLLCGLEDAFDKDESLASHLPKRLHAKAPKCNGLLHGSRGGRA